MKPQIATSREQSERLLKCGVDPKTADMVWTTFDNDGEKSTKLDVMDEYAYEFASLHPIPAWSLSALLSMLPTPIVKGNSMQGTFQLTRTSPTLKGCWVAQYISYHEALFQTTQQDIIEAIVQTIEWLTQNGYKLNEP